MGAVRRFGEQSENFTNFLLFFQENCPNVADFCPTKGGLQPPATPSPMLMKTNYCRYYAGASLSLFSRNYGANAEYFRYKEPN